MSDVIAAIATGNVRSAIGIIRVSGDGAIDSVSKVFRPKKYLRMEDVPSGRLVYGEFISAGGQVIDLCLCTVSRAPHSYTGEDTAEIQCHGSPVVMSEGLRALFDAGARQATPGEFTKRAFLNGKLDLTAAEAVIDIIDAETADAAKNAAGQLSGAVVRKTDAIYSSLINISAHFHAVVDWPDEDIEDFQAENYIEVMRSAERKLSKLLETFTRGRILREGVRCAIIGRPNVGKSSLLNAILGYDRAIVTDIAGTTRDTIEEKAVVGGVLLRLTDTAGLRDTADDIERIGVLRAEQAAEEAELVIGVFDGAYALTNEDERTLEYLKNSEKAIAVVNKDDLPREVDFEKISAASNDPIIISAVTGEGIAALGERVRTIFGNNQPPTGEILTNERQANEVRRARDAIISALNAMETGFTSDIILTELEEGIDALSSISGKNFRENIIDNIFTRFCVGK